MGNQYDQYGWPSFRIHIYFFTTRLIQISVTCLIWNAVFATDE